MVHASHVVFLEQTWLEYVSVLDDFLVAQNPRIPYGVYGWLSIAVALVPEILF